MSEPSEVLDAPEAARMLGVAVDELYALAARGELRPVPQSWPLRVRRAELKAYIARAYGPCLERRGGPGP